MNGKEYFHSARAVFDQFRFYLRQKYTMYIKLVRYIDRSVKNLILIHTFPAILTRAR